MHLIDINGILKAMPHRYPFLLVDRITDIVDTEDEKIVKGYKNVSFNEPFFQGHFPDEPVMPGVLVVEAMGQIACVLLKAQPEYQNGRNVVYLTSLNNVKFRKPVRPGDRLESVARLIKRRGNIGKFHVEATVDGELAAEADLGFVISSGLTL